MRGDRNVDLLMHIVDYCNEIKNTIKRFGNDYGTFSNDNVYQNAVALCVLQIGELTTHFTEDFKNTYDEILKHPAAKAPIGSGGILFIPL